MTVSRGIKKPHPSPVLDAFADLLADGVAPREAADQLGYRRAYATCLLHKICRRLGPQAI